MSSSKGQPRWSYAGDTGPAHWGELDPSYDACATGREQSPIDLALAVNAPLGELEFSCRGLTFELENDGYTVRATASAGATLLSDGVAYELVELHYHAPSEHRIDRRPFALELHLVTRSPAGGLLVLGVLVARGPRNRAFDRLVAALPAGPGERAELSGLDPFALLPEEGRGPRYAYQGSLTTPPCTEGVLWNVFATPVALSGAQIERFTAIHEGINRPLQPRNGRALTLGSAGG